MQTEGFVLCDKGSPGDSIRVRLGEEPDVVSHAEVSILVSSRTLGVSERAIREIQGWES